MNSPFEDMKEQLKTGIKAVSAPHLFTTPPTLTQEMADMLNVSNGIRILEPSAGTGVLIDAVAPHFPHITACEINNDLAQSLIHNSQANIVRQCDFLTMELGDAEPFDAVIMNPPFDNGQDIKHILHALTMLKEGGQLVAICSGGPRQKAKLEPLCDYWEPLPPGTFKASGTMVNTVLLSITKD